MRPCSLATAPTPSSFFLTLSRDSTSLSAPRSRSIAGCGVPAEACQVHHLTEWADGGPTDPHNLVLVCWTHHRQVDLTMWTIHPTDPDAPPQEPHPGAPPGTPWPANNGAPWTITRTPRTRWRL